MARYSAAVRESAKGSVSHYPLYAHAHRYPPRHRGSWVFVIVMLVAMTGITVFLLPAEVNAWRYVVGAANQDTFNPVSYGQACGGGVGHGVSWRRSRRCPCPLAQIRAESANHIIPIAVTTEAAFVALHAVGEVGADDRAGGCGQVADPARWSGTPDRGSRLADVVALGVADRGYPVA